MLEGKSVEAKLRDRGSTTLPRVPPPVNLSMGTNNCTAQCRLDAVACSDCARLSK